MERIVGSITVMETSRLAGWLAAPAPGSSSNGKHSPQHRSVHICEVLGRFHESLQLEVGRNRLVGGLRALGGHDGVVRADSALWWYVVVVRNSKYWLAPTRVTGDRRAWSARCRPSVQVGNVERMLLKRSQDCR